MEDDPNKMTVKDLMTQVQLKVNELSKTYTNYLFADILHSLINDFVSVGDLTADFFIHHPDFSELNQKLLKVLLLNLGTANVEHFTDYTAYLKIYLIKTNFKHLGDYLKVIYEVLTEYIDNEEYRAKAFKQILSILQVSFACTSHYSPASSFMLSGLSPGFRVDFDNAIENYRFFLNNNFTVFTVFYCDLKNSNINANESSTPVLFSFKNRYSNTGYYLKLINNELVFISKTSDQLPDKNTEIVIFSNFSEIVSSNWNTFIFSCEYIPKSSLSILSFILNDHQYSMKLSIENAFAKTTKHTMHAFDYISCQLTAFMVFDRVISHKIYKDLGNPLLSKGIVNLEGHNRFYKLFEKLIDQHMVSLWFSPMSNIKNLADEMLLYDMIRKKEIIANIDNVMLNQSNPVNFDNNILSLQTIELTFVLMNYIQNSEELELILKVMNELLSRENYLEMQFQINKRNIFQEVLGAFLGSNCYSYLDYTTCDLLVQPLFCLKEELKRKYLNEFLLNFHFIDKFLISQESTKIYFNLILKYLDQNQDIFNVLDMNNLLEIYITLLHTGSYLNFHKASNVYSLLKLKILTMQNLENCNIEPLLYYLSELKFDRLNSLVNTMKLLELFLNYPIVVKKYKDKAIFSLFNIINKVDDSILLIKTFRIILSLDSNIEHMLIALWRTKILKENTNDKLKKVYQTYNKQIVPLDNKNALVSFVLSLVFEIDEDVIDIPPDELRFNKQQYFGLFFEISLALDTIGIQNVLQILIVSLRQYPKKFVENFKKTSISVWLISLIISSVNVESKSAVYDLAFKLYSQHLYHSIKDGNDLGPFTYSFELLGYYTQEPGYEKLNFDILYGVLKLFNDKNLSITQEQSLHVLIANLFKFFYLNLSIKPEEAIVNRTYIELLNFLHRIINMNSNANIIHIISKSLLAGNIYNRFFSFNSLNISKQNISMNSSLTLDQSVNKEKETSVIPLKLITLMILDMLKYFNNLKVYTYMAIIFKFISSFFHEVLFYIEINRSKLKTPRVNQIETCLYNFIINIFKDENNKDFIGEIKDDIIKMGAEDIENGFSSYIIEVADLYQNTTHDLFFKILNKRIINNAFYIEIYDDRSFTIEIHDYILTTIGEINDKMKPKIDLYESLDVKYEIFEKLLFIRNTCNAEYHVEFIHFINSYLIEKKIELQNAKNLYHKIYKEQREPSGTLFKLELLKYFQNFDLFDPKNIEYNDIDCPVSYKHRNFITKEYQRPFIKITVKPYYKKINWKAYDDYIDKFRIAQHFSNRDCYFFRVEYIKKLFIIESFIVINKTKKKLFICYDFSDSKPRTNNLQIANFSLKPYKKYLVEIDLDFIVEAQEYKFLQSRTALEIFFANRKSLIVNFNNRNILEDFSYILFESCSNIKLKTISTKKLSKAQNIKNKWSKEGRISNFEYIMLLNKYSSRSINDFSQYPVFPLIIKRNGSSFTLRDLSKPIGMTGEERRIKTFKKRFDSTDSFTDNPRYFYGSHYSSPAIVFHFLIRLKPYTLGCKSIQNGSFDLPDRLFFSIEHMLKNVNEEMSDVRELIPEAFYLPSMFINFNKYNLGVTQMGHRVNNVELPKSFDKNPYKFIYELRKLLESKEVSESLGSWIDLIFGCKQQGQSAIDACNVFYYLTYESQLKNIKYENDKHKTAIETQIYHFGQIPFQLFMNSHPNRRIDRIPATIISLDAPVKYFLKKREDNLSSSNPIHLIKEIKTSYSAATKRTTIKIVAVKDKCVEYYKFNTITASMAPNKIPFEFVLAHTIDIGKLKQQMVMKSFDVFYSNVVEFYGEDKLVLGGFKNGMIAVISLKALRVINEIYYHDYLVSSLQLSKNDVLLSSDIQGIISISLINTTNDKIQQIYKISDHYGGIIRNIDFYTDDQEFFIINTEKGVVEVRSISKPHIKLFRITNELTDTKNINSQNNHYFSKTLLSFSYLSSVVTYSYADRKSYLHSFSLEGNLIGRYSFESNYEEPLEHFILLKDEYFKENLIACSRQGDIFLFDLPFFDNGRKISSTQSVNITTVIAINNRKTLLLGDDKGVIDIFSLLSE